MSNAHAAELSALTSAATDLRARVVSIAHRYDDDRHQGLLAALHDAERALRTVARSLERASRLQA